MHGLIMTMFLMMNKRDAALLHGPISKAAVV